MVANAYKSFEHDDKQDLSYRILGYAKPMQKTIYEMGTCKDNYIEREWRKVYSCPSPLKWLSENEYYIYRGDRSVSKQPKGNILHFSTKVIVFIIIPKKFKSDLLDYIMNEMETIGGSTPITIADRLELISKIVEYENLVYNI